MCDNPYDKNREIGFTDPITGITIPFEMKGTFATFKTRVPRDKELQECIYITMTNDNPWNSSEFDANISTVTRMNVVTEDANPNEIHTKWINNSQVHRPYIQVQCCSNE